MANYKVKLTMGDWSRDGHEESDIFRYISNYPVETIRKAYKESCKLTGLTFSLENYTNLDIRYGSWRYIWTEYEDSHMDEEAIDILKEFGLDVVELYHLDDTYSFEPKSASDLMMRFIKLSMPSDWDYTLDKDEYEPINGWWNDDLNVQFGYGLYS